MTEIEKELLEDAKAKLKAYNTCLDIVKVQMDFMPVVPHEMLMIKAAIEGRIIGSKNFIRSLK